MRSLFPLILGILSVPCLAGETDVLKPGEAGATPRTMLSRDLLNKARRAFQKRREAVAALKNVDDLEKRRSELKAKFIAGSSFISTIECRIQSNWLAIFLARLLADCAPLSHEFTSVRGCRKLYQFGGFKLQSC